MKFFRRIGFIINPKLLIIIVLVMCVSTLKGQERNLVVDLKGKWKFTIGDNSDYVKKDYDDKNWDAINVPAFWEEQGFNGYDGYACYRKKFRINSSTSKLNLQLVLGYIDDVDAVYINGRFLAGTGAFPPAYQSAYNIERVYSLPSEFLDFTGENVISVKVYDGRLGGGINSGDIGVYVVNNKLVPELTLEGFWKFRTGDNPEWAKPSTSDAGWGSIVVPATWESQGFQGYDGLAWYRRNCKIPDFLKNAELYLIAGKIDDFDEVYFNGVKIGATADFNLDIARKSPMGEWQILRVYRIPHNLINKQGDNLIAIRVCDNYLNGGIYEGPVGIATKERFESFSNKENKEEKKSFLNWFLGK